MIVHSFSYNYSRWFDQRFLRYCVALSVLFFSLSASTPLALGQSEIRRSSQPPPVSAKMSGSSLLSEQLAQAISSPGLLARLVSTAYSGVEAQEAVFQQKLQGFPVQGNSYIILSTGIATQAPGHATRFVSVNMGGTVIPGGSPDGFNAYDVATLTLRLNLAGLSPSPAPKLVFYFKFCTDENLSFVESAYQDYFTAYVKDSSGNPITNVALVPSGKPVTVRNADPYSNDVKGTSHNPLPPFPFPDDVAYNACTQLLGASFDLLPFIGQEILIEFQVGDASDPIYDSAVFIDGLDIVGATGVDLQPRRIEVNQAIQTADNTIPLVAKKPTVVRIWVDANGAPASTNNVRDKKISAQLHVKKDGQPLPGSPFLPEPRVDGQRTRTISELLTGNSFNFYFDGKDGPLLEAGSYEFSVEIDSNLVVFEDNENNNSQSVGPYAFREGRSMRIIYHPIWYLFSTPHVPDHERLAGAHEFLKKVYPIAPETLSYIKLGTLYLILPIYGEINQLLLYLKLSTLLKIYNIFHDPDADFGVGFLPPIIPNLRGYTYPPALASTNPPHGIPKDPAHGAVVVFVHPDYFRRTLAHEIGHRFGLNVVGEETYDCNEIGQHAFDVEGRRSIAPWNCDFMSNREESLSWVNTISYSHIAQQLVQTLAGVTALSQPLSNTEFIILSGLISKQDEVQLNPFYRLTGTATPSTFPGGPYSIEFVDASSNVLNSYSFDLDFRILDSQDADWAPFSFVVPYPANSATILFKHNSQVIHSIAVSSNNPSVQVLTPNGGETLSGTVTISWSMSDPDNDILYASVFYTPDGTNWFTLASNLTESSFEWDTSQVGGGIAGKIRVVVSDGINTSQDESDGTFTVQKKPPIVTILNPEDSAVITLGDTIVLEGAADDPEDGTLGGDQLLWSSSIDGNLGSGESLAMPYLSPGTHTITLTATDSDGNSTSTSISILVTTPDTQSPAAPTGLAAIPKYSAVELSWNPNGEPDLAGYKIYYGTLGSGNYQESLNVGNVTSYQLQNLTPGTTYYIAVTAYDTAGNESAPSNEVTVIPLVEPRIEGTATAFNSAGQPIVVVQLNSTLPTVVTRPKGGTRKDCASQSPIQFCRTLPKQVRLNQVFNITLTLKNIGSSTLARVRMEDILPSNVQVVSGKLVKECRNLRRRATCSNTYRVKVTSASATADQMVALQVLAIEGLSARDGTIRFLAQGEGIKDIQIAVFDLSGRLIFNSDWVANNFLWNGQNMRGSPLANGVYLYVVRVRGFDWREYVSAVRKLVILR